MGGIVVGLSRWHTCDRALRWASDEARLHGLALTAVHAWNEPVDVEVDLDPSSLPALRGHATFRGVQGSPRAVLAAVDAHLIVLGVRAPSPHMAALVRDVVRAAVHVPVAVVPEPGQEWGNDVVTVGVCGTPASAAALRWGAREADVRGARLVVVHAWSLHPGPSAMRNPARAVVLQAIEETRALDTWVRSVLGPRPVQLRAEHAPRLEALLGCAADADVLVLGRSSHSRFGQALLGAISNDVGALAPCPVVVVPEG